MNSIENQNQYWLNSIHNSSLFYIERNNVNMCTRKVTTMNISIYQPSPDITFTDKVDINPMTTILANGQPLLTNFKEKYLIHIIWKILNKDIETILKEEKFISFDEWIIF